MSEPMHSDHPYFSGIVEGILMMIEDRAQNVCPRCFSGSLIMTMVATLARDGHLSPEDLDHLVSCVQEVKAEITPAEKLN